jgi:hypothetical protein
MKKYLIAPAAALFLLHLTACKKYPEACIVSDKNDITLGETITFSDCSKNAEKKMWDFGDGTTAEGDGKSHTYQNAGTYLVTLKVFSKKDKFLNNASQLITVNPIPVEPPAPPPAPPKTRFLNGITLTGFPLSKPDGGTWDNAIPLLDPTTDPDVRIRISIANSNFVFTTSTQNNMTIANLPFEWDYSPTPFKLTNANWTIKMIDYDAGLAGVGEGEETMAEWTINPTTITLSNNIISLSTPEGGLIELHIEEK